MGNCAACADQAGGTETKLQELPDNIGFTELSQMHYIEQTQGDKKSQNVARPPINLRFRIVTKNLFPELYDESLKEKKEQMQKTGLLSDGHTETRAVMYKVAYGTQVQIWEEEMRARAEPFSHS